MAPDAGSCPADNGLVTDIDPARFEEMVADALDALPEEFGRLMSNVAVTVENGQGPPGLLGLYRGIPLTERTTSYAGVLPDRITLYWGPLMRNFPDDGRLADQVRKTLYHEIAHYFGMNEEDLHGTSVR